MKRPPLCVSTLDLHWFGHGGLVSMADAFMDAASECGFDPWLLTPDSKLHRTVRRTLGFESLPTSQRGTFHDHPLVGLGASFPEFESRAHHFDRSMLASLFTEDQPCFAVSGNNHAALPFLALGKPFSLWIASTFDEDHRHQIASGTSLLRRLADHIDHPFSLQLEKEVFQRAQSMAVLTSYTERMVKSVAPTARARPDIIPVPVKVPAQAAPIAQSIPRFTFIGRLSDPRKNLELLLTSANRLGGLGRQFQLTLVGRGREAIARQLACLSQNIKVEILEDLDEEAKDQCLRASMALVIPSHQEGLGITGLEAMARGVPVISTPCGGPEDFVTDGETGVLLKTFDASEMSEQMGRLLDSPASALKLGKAARERVLREFSIATVRPRLCEFITRATRH